MRFLAAMEMRSSSKSALKEMYHKITLPINPQQNMENP
jgi:hypothetical protein